jgi:uncharacterized protein YihD (DUF1040 family)
MEISMREKDRINRILNNIEELWVANPDLRLMQLLMNVLELNQDPYYVEDDILEKKLKEYSDREV